MLVDIRIATVNPDGTITYSQPVLTAGPTPTPTPTPAPTPTPTPTPAPTPTPTPTATGTLLNWHPTSQFVHATAAASASIAKTGQFRALFVGDSTMYGVGATRLTSPPAYAAAAFSGVSPTLSGVNEWIAAGDPTDTRTVFSGATGYSGQACFGGPVADMHTPTDGLVFSPGVPFDHVRVIYCDIAHGFDIAVDGTVSGSPVPDGYAGGGMLSHTWTVAHGVHTIGLRPLTSELFIQGIEVWDSTVAGQVLVYNGGAGGSDSSCINYSPTFTSYTSGMLAIGGNIAIINLGSNDLNNGAPLVDAFTANMTAGVAYLQAQNCDPILVFPPSVNSTGYVAGGDAYLAALLSVATAKNVPLIDCRKYFGPFASMPTTWVADNMHKTAVFYDLIGTLYAKLIAVATGQATPAVASEIAALV